MDPLHAACASLLILLATGCASTTRALDVTPTPAALPVFAALRDGDIDAPPAGHMLVAVGRAERRDGQPDGPWELLVRLRLENRDAERIALQPGSLRVVDAELTPFGPPRWTDGPPAEVGRGEHATWLARMAFPAEGHPGTRALRGLQLRAEVLVDGLLRVLDVTFTRTEPQVIVEQVPYPVGWHRFGLGLGYGGVWAW